MDPNETPEFAPVEDGHAPELETRPEFHITDEASANWLLRKLANIEAEKKRVTANAAAIVAQLDSDADRLLHVYGSELQAWTRAELARKGNRRKSLPLLQGTCQFRTVPAGVRLADLPAALSYAKNAVPHAVHTSVTLDTVKYRSVALTALATNGEVLPGMQRTEERESFSVKFGAKD